MHTLAAMCARIAVSQNQFCGMYHSQEDLPELVPEIPSHYELPWRHAFGRPYTMGTVSYMGAARQATPLHYDDVENLVRAAFDTGNMWGTLC